MNHESNPPKKIYLGKIPVPRPRHLAEEPQTGPDTPNTLSTKPEPQEPAAEPVVSAAPTAQTHKQGADRNPLRQYSLLGHASALALSAAETKPLLGKFVMQGQATMIYAEPNTGKTLIILYLCLIAIELGLIEAKYIYFINADDSSSGLAVKGRLLEDVGAHMLAPGLRGFRIGDLAKLLIQAADEGSARGMCVAIDTLKKFTDLMDKKRSSEFAQACRQFVMAGGTIVALGHTAKNPNADGTPRYQGTTDILEDFDAVYVAQPLTSKAKGNQRVVKFTRKKSRADSPETVAYVYVSEPGISYEEKLASVQSIDPDDMDDYAIEEEVSDPIVMHAFTQLIKAGSVLGKMALAFAVSKDRGISHRAAIGVLERYTGTVPNTHLWDFDKGARGVRVYRLIDQMKPDS